MVHPWPDGAQQAQAASGASWRLGWYGWRLLQGRLSAAQGRFGLQHQLVKGLLMVVLMGSAVKARIASQMLALRGSVPEDAVDELLNGQCHPLGAMVAVVGVLEADGGVVEEQGPFLGQRPTLDVASQVQRHAVAVLVDVADLDIEVFAVQRADDAAPVGGVHLRRQAQAVVREQLAEQAEELAAKQPLQRHGRDRDVGAAGLPLPLCVQAAGRDEAVQVRVVGQIASPGVQRHQKARHHAQAAGVSQEFKQAGASAVEEQLRHMRAVEGPKREQFVRNGEDRVEVSAGQKPQHLRVDPTRAGRLDTARARTMATGVRLKPLVVPFGTAQDMRAQRRGVALADGLGRPLLATMQRAGGCIGGVVLDEHVLERATHHGGAAQGCSERYESSATLVAMSNVRVNLETTE